MDKIDNILDFVILNRDFKLLYIIETYAYYDMPLLYLSMGSDNNKYIVITERTENTLIHKCIQISDNILEIAKKENISLYNLYKNSESGYIIIIIESEYDDKITIIDCDNISDSLLPNQNIYLNKP